MKAANRQKVECEKRGSGYYTMIRTRGIPYVIVLKVTPEMCRGKNTESINAMAPPIVSETYS